MIVLRRPIIYASSESEKNIVHFELYTERLSKKTFRLLACPLRRGLQTSRLECRCQSDWIIKLNK